MRRLLLALLLLVPALAWAQASRGLDPSQLPPAPTQAPPPVGVAKDTIEAHPGAVLQYTLPAGFSVVSFPFARLVAAEGFTHCLLEWVNGQYVAVDPVATPEKVDTAYAFLAYAEGPVTVRVRGTAQGGPRVARLDPGWNLLGCPSPTAIAWSRVTLVRAGGVTRGVETAASPDRKPSSAWLYSTAYTSPGGVSGSIDLRAPTAQLAPTEDTWVFAWQEVELHWNPSGVAPRIASLSDTSVAPGETLVLKGTAFGQRGQGLAVIGRVPVQAEDVLQWTPTLIKLRVSNSVRTGRVMVVVDGVPSNRVDVQVGAKAPPPAATGTLTGRVFAADGSPLADAQVMLDDGQTVTTDASGAFRITGLPGGVHQAYISKIGYATGTGQVTVEAGKQHSLKVQLSPIGRQAQGQRTQAPEPTGTLYVYAYAFDSDNKRWWPSRVEAWEYGRSSRTWRDTWYSDLGDPYRSLRCDGAHQLRTYSVAITWKNNLGQERTGRFDREWRSGSEAIRFYSDN